MNIKPLCRTGGSSWSTCVTFRTVHFRASLIETFAKCSERTEDQGFTWWVSGLLLPSPDPLVASVVFPFAWGPQGPAVRDGRCRSTSICSSAADVTAERVMFFHQLPSAAVWIILYSYIYIYVHIHTYLSFLEFVGAKPQVPSPAVSFCHDTLGCWHILQSCWGESRMKQKDTHGASATCLAP